MNTFTITALTDTVIKQFNVDITSLPDSSKFYLTAREELEINSYELVANHHLELELTSPRNGTKIWFADTCHLTFRVNLSETEVLEEIKNSDFKVYHKPTDQDTEGNGIPANGENNLSEKLFPVYVLRPRRQTDSLVRQLLMLLPFNDTAFIIAERLVQYPEDYLPTISQFKKAVIVQSFVGVGLESDPILYPEWAVERHNKELWILEQSIRLLQSMDMKISAVVCAMGDSLKDSSKKIRDEMQNRLYKLLDKSGLSDIKQSVTWGADELVAMAMAQTLPKTKVRVRISNPDALMSYDGKRPAQECVAEKLPAVRLVQTDNDWDFEVAILTRHEFGDIDGYEVNDTQQDKLDKDFLHPYKHYTPKQRSKLVIIDARLYNGAWNSGSVLPDCDLLAFGAWGTFSNCVGSTLAVAKILFYAKNAVAQKQLYLEAVAHDVFANGYKEAQRRDEPGSFCNKLENETGIEFDHFYGYKNSATTGKVFALLNQHVNQKMQQHFKETPCLKNRSFRITPQLWRTFESEVHISPRLPGEVHEVGIYRTDLEPQVFDPSFSESA